MKEERREKKPRIIAGVCDRLRCDDDDGGSGGGASHGSNSQKHRSAVPTYYIHNGTFSIHNAHCIEKCNIRGNCVCVCVHKPKHKQRRVRHNRRYPLSLYK